MLDTSIEVDKLNIGNLPTSVGNDNVVRFITENQVRGRLGEDDVQPHCSREEVPTLSNRVPERPKAEQMIRDAEAARENIYNVPVNVNLTHAVYTQQF